ncbi:CCA tRNA nucleotidyltransferase [Sulfitobacter sp. W027]|uniref:CCA tRNA nucleotidyltransferase n=1 Tax=Sulfitobacter sp. W027 TaxID=2867025 RepID=UPI0021A94378|nr:CCA tRNA nucleotidyltransferase [Sulfitobacter sp. W027]UWR33576.1 CCA tRNA nucleotidyltransferase [Sulfitobacter sp. W027]
MGDANEQMIPASTRWLQDEDAQRVCRVVQDGGHRIYFVGGCVRDALLGLPDSDVDLSTDATPETVMALAKAAGVKAVPTGIDHGTVTLVSGGKPFEITTFRRDVETDGRRAVVAFSTDITEDARRRDFTMNALYATPDGQVLDPLGGLPDLRAKRLRFIEDAGQRIREDYLRTLRYFRFMAWYGDPETGPEPDALDAISSNLDGLKTLSAERVGQEFKKLLRAPDPAPALALMRQTGVLPVLLPGSDNRWISMLVHFEQALELAPDWLVRLAALGGEGLAGRLRLSRVEAKRLALFQEQGFAGPPLPELAYRHGVEVARGAALLRACLAEKSPESAVLETIDRAASARFPVTAKDLMPKLKGPELGCEIARLEQIWIASDFSLSRTELLSGAS